MTRSVPSAASRTAWRSRKASTAAGHAGMRRGAVYEALRHDGFWSIRMGGVPVILYPGECRELPPPRPAQKDPGAACARGEETEKKETRIC